MPTKPKTPCAQAGCPELTRERYCEKHGRQEAKRHDRERGTAAQRGYGARWQRARKRHLRKNPLCVECKQSGRVTPATTVDHIIPHKGDQELFWDESNWHGLCKPHHDSKTAKEDGGWGRMDRPKVTLVCGPPGSGKSSYVDEHSRPGDLLVDMDRIWQALTGLPRYEKPEGFLAFVLEARDAVLTKLEQPSPIYRAWVIIGLPVPSKRAELAHRLQAKVVVLAVPEHECVYRISQDESRADKAELWRPIVQDWWRQYGPNEGETVLPASEG